MYPYVRIRPAQSDIPVEGETDHDRLLDQFGADELTDAQRARFPEPVHPLVRRRVFYAERDLARVGCPDGALGDR